MTDWEREQTKNQEKRRVQGLGVWGQISCFQNTDISLSLIGKGSILGLGEQKCTLLMLQCKGTNNLLF